MQFKIIELVSIGFQVLKPKAFFDWMTRAVPGLGDRRPMDMLDTETHIQDVINVLDRIRHG